MNRIISIIAMLAVLGLGSTEASHCPGTTGSDPSGCCCAMPAEPVSDSCCGDEQNTDAAPMQDRCDCSINDVDGPTPDLFRAQESFRSAGDFLFALSPRSGVCLSHNTDAKGTAWLGAADPPGRRATVYAVNCSYLL